MIDQKIKNAIDALQADYISHILEGMRSGKTKITQSGNSERSEVDLSHLVKGLKLIAYQSHSGETKYAKYVYVGENTAYVRDLL